MGTREHGKAITRSEFVGRLAIVLICLVLAIVTLTSLRQSRPGENFARAIALGKTTARIVTSDDAEDQNLIDDEVAAGSLWARHNRPPSVKHCPRYSAAFQKGCADALMDP